MIYKMLTERRKKSIFYFMKIDKFFIWTNLNPLYLRMLCAKFGWNWPSGSGEKDFFNSVNVFSLFGNYLFLEKGGALLWRKLYPLYPRMLCAKFGWNWSSGSGIEHENVKSVWQRQQRKRRQRRREKLTWAFGSGEVKKYQTGFKFFYFFRFEKLKLYISLFSFIYLFLSCFCIHCSNDILIC